MGVSYDGSNNLQRAADHHEKVDFILVVCHLLVELVTKVFAKEYDRNAQLGQRRIRRDDAARDLKRPGEGFREF